MQRQKKLFSLLVFLGQGRERRWLFVGRVLSDHAPLALEDDAVRVAALAVYVVLR